MLNSLHLGNFKAFGETQKIPIKPLTLIFGANSAGKSSLLHGLLLAINSLQRGDFDVTETTVGGKSVDLGGFRQYVHQRNLARRVQLGVETDVSTPSSAHSALPESVKSVLLMVDVGMALNDVGNPEAEAVPEVLAYRIESDGRTFLRMSRRPDGSLRADSIDHDHPILRHLIQMIIAANSTTEELNASDWAVALGALDAVVPSIRGRVERLFPALGEPKSGSADRGKFLLSQLQPIGRATREQDLTRTVELFLPHILAELQNHLVAQVEEQLQRVQYLGPLRSYPPRHLIYSEVQDQNWVAGGGYAWDVVRKDRKVRDAVNQWLTAGHLMGSRYELVVREHIAIDQIEPSIATTLDMIQELQEAAGKEGGEYDIDSGEWARHTQTSLSLMPIDKLQELQLVDRRTKTNVSHRDVGIGISQVLPVLVAAYASEDKIIAMEQPEIHLHPALQAELGDVFIESALNHGNAFLLETHSEHLILRVMRRIRETFNGSLPEGATPLRPDDVAVLFVEPRGEASVVREMPLNERGDLVKAWPGGFFEEGLREVLP